MRYTAARDRFVAQTTREGLPLQAATQLLRIATTMQRLAELACSSEWHCNTDHVPCPGASGGVCLCDWQAGTASHESIPRITLQSHRAALRADVVIWEVNDMTGERWTINTQGDPRGCVLGVIPPSYANRNAGRTNDNLDSIGVPARDSRLRF